MTLTRPDAERLARILTLEIGSYCWGKHACGCYCPNEFRIESSRGGTSVLYIPLAGDMAHQAGALAPEAFIQWFNDALVSVWLTEAETVGWLLAQASRFDAADVNGSLQEFEFVDFETPFTYRYDWDGVLRLAAVLQGGASLEYRFHLWLPPTHRDTMIRMEWRASGQDYRIVAIEMDQGHPCLKIIGDVDDFGAFFKEHYNSSAARTWMDFIRSHRTPASDHATERLREEFAIPLTPESCQPFLQALRGGRVWLLSGDRSTEDWNAVSYEEGKYVHRWSEHVIETGMGGNMTYEGPAGGSEVWTEQQAIEMLKSTVEYRHRLQKILEGWG